MQLAHTLHLQSTAEGVEELEQRDALALLGCTHIQGFLYSPPVPGDKTSDYPLGNGSPCGSADRVPVAGPGATDTRVG